MAEWQQSRTPLCAPGAGSNPGNVFQWRYDKRRRAVISILLIRDISLAPHLRTLQAHTGYGYKRFCKSLHLK